MAKNKAPKSTSTFIRVPSILKALSDGLGWQLTRDGPVIVNFTPN